MKKYIINFFSVIYSKLIILNLFLIKLKSKNFFYNHSLAFGDTICYFLNNFNKIKNSKKNLPVAFGSFNEEIVKFFFNDYQKLFFKIFKFFPYYSISVNLIKSKFFLPKINYKIDDQGFMIDELLLKKKSFKIFKNILKKKKITKKILDLSKKKYICIFVKKLNNNINDISTGAHIRQTTNLKKIVSIINYLLNHKIEIVILGNSRDKGSQFLQKKFNHTNNIFFLNNFKPSISEQFYIASKSIGYLGGHSGIVVPFILLKKKIVFFESYIFPSLNYYTRLNNISFLLKKILINKKKYFLDNNHLKLTKNTKYKIIENNYEEIKKKAQNFLK